MKIKILALTVIFLTGTHPHSQAATAPPPTTPTTSGLIGAWNNNTPIGPDEQPYDIEVGDFNSDGIVQVSETLPLSAAGSKKLFYLEHHPIHKLIDIKLNGALYARDKYSYQPRHGIITLADNLTTSNNVVVTYEYSTKLDIVTFIGDNHEDIIWENQSNLEFVGDVLALNPTPNAYKAGAVLDVDGDGNLDLVSVGKDMAIRRNYGAGGWDLVVQSLPIGSAFATDVQAGDINDDGLLDLVISGYYDFASGAGTTTRGFISIYRNMGGGVFAERWIKFNDFNLAIPLGGGVNQVIDLADADNDGKLDILYGSKEDIGIYKNTSVPRKLFQVTNTDEITAIPENDLEGIHLPTNISATFADISDIKADAKYVYISGSTLSGGSTLVGTIAKMDKNLLTLSSTYAPLSGPGSSSRIDCIYFDSKNSIYGMSSSLTNQTKLIKLNKDTLAFVAAMGSTGSGNDQFQNPAGITGDKTYLYISDADNNRIVKRKNSDLSYVAQAVPVAGEKPGAIWQENGQLYVSMPNYSHVVTGPSDFSTSFSEIIGTGSNVLNGPVVGITGTRETLFLSVDRSPPHIFTFSLTSLAPTGDYTQNGISHAGPISIHRLEKEISFQTIPLFSDTSVKHNKEVIFADMNDDGVLDIVSFGYDSGGTVNKTQILTYDSGLDSWAYDSGFGPSVASIQVPYGGDAGDLNGDGLLDIAFAANAPTIGVDPGIYMYENDSGVFANYWISSEDPDPAYNDFKSNKMVIADFDGDGENELATTAYKFGAKKHVAVFKKNSSKLNRFTEITSTVMGANGEIHKIIAEYELLPDDTLGNVVAVNVY